MVKVQQDILYSTSNPLSQGAVRGWGVWDTTEEVEVLAHDLIFEHAQTHMDKCTVSARKDANSNCLGHVDGTGTGS